MKQFNNKTIHNNGQVMILTVVILGGVIISTASLISYLVINNLKQSTDMSLSARAVFASDTGREWELWKALKDGTLPLNGSDGTCPRFTNGAEFTAGVSYYDAVSTSTLKIVSAGKINKDIRVWGWIWGVSSSTPVGYPFPPTYIQTTCK